jgi:ParB family transcriptional regulator, chromosome partitioning protein
MTSIPSPINTQTATLRDVPIELIDRNPENPRIIFRAGELEELLRSIQKYGVQVPISVYKEGKRFILIDGERRWKCSVKLNKKTIPAVIQEKPTVLNNLLLMFNIHSLREQWDLLTMATKLPRVIDLLKADLQRGPTEIELAEQTGLSRSTLRRCKWLIDLPDEYRQLMLAELKKPKAQQKLTEDFFIEMERGLKTVERAMPNTIQDKDDVRQVLINKYKSGVIVNRTDFRYLGKIARAQKVDADTSKAASVLRRAFTGNKYSIEQAYQDSVSGAYSERDVLTRINSLIERLDALRVEDIDDELRESLEELVERAQLLLGSAQ